jgi:sirohydrochlorin ferrochelatase
MSEDVLVAVAHGSQDPRAAATIEKLMAQVRSQAGDVDMRTAYLGHATPSLPQVLGELPERAGRRVTVLPLLLTPAYHSKTDIPRVLAHSGRRDLTYTGTLGPHPLLLRALDRRLAETGAGVGAGAGLSRAERKATAVVLVAAGSSDPQASAIIERLAARWQARAGWRAVVPGYASACSPTPAEAIAAARADGARRVVVATYLLAPGYFADRVRADALAAGADAVSAALGAAPEVAGLVLERYRAVRSAGGRAAA